MSKKNRKIINMIAANKATKHLANQYKRAVSMNNIESQRKIIKKCQEVGIYIKRGKLTSTVSILELHYNNKASSVNEQKSHMAYFDAKNEMLDSGPHVGVSAPGESTDCLWAEKGWVSTLDKTSVAVPEWLGKNITIPSPQMPTDKFFDNIFTYINAHTADLVDTAANAAAAIS